MSSKVFVADVKRLEDVISFVEQELALMQCPKSAVRTVDVALEEIFVNVAHYAYPGGVGSAEIKVEDAKEKSGAEITITDEGAPYNPLEKTDPDITLQANERDIGGLGIYMVKKMMDEVSYEFKNNKNMFRMTKYF